MRCDANRERRRSSISARQISARPHVMNGETPGSGQPRDVGEAKLLCRYCRRSVDDEYMDAVGRIS